MTLSLKQVHTNMSNLWCSNDTKAEKWILTWIIPSPHGWNSITQLLDITFLTFKFKRQVPVGDTEPRELSCPLLLCPSLCLSLWGWCSVASLDSIFFHFLPVLCTKKESLRTGSVNSDAFHLQHAEDKWLYVSLY